MPGWQKHPSLRLRRKRLRDLGNKLFLFTACSYLLWLTEIDTAAVVSFCISITGSCLCTYFGHSGRTTGLISVFGLLCLIQPVFGIYLPLVLYDAVLTKNKFCFVIIAPAHISALLWLSGNLLFPFLLISGSSILLSCYSSHLATLLQELHHTRDEGAEIQMILRERNQALIRNQNYEIHLATLSERNRIAREIHDNVGHMLTRSILQTGALKVINQDPNLEEPLITLKNTLNTAMTSIRTSVHDLHDDVIDMQAVLNDLIRQVQTPGIQLEYDMGNRIPREIKYSFISIIKEAINNIQKHSDADSAWIKLREHPGFYQLEIRDNGSLNKLPAETDGIGLANMRERVRSLGGTIQFSVRGGFCINISILKKGNQNQI